MITTYYLAGLIIVGILLMLILLKYRGKRVREEWMALSFIIGITSLPIGLGLEKIMDMIFSVLHLEWTLASIFIFPVLLAIILSVLLSIWYTFLRTGYANFSILASAVSFLILEPVMEIIAGLFLAMDDILDIFYSFMIVIMLSISCCYHGKDSRNLFAKVSSISLLILLLVMTGWILKKHGEGGFQ